PSFTKSTEAVVSARSSPLACTLRCEIKNFSSLGFASNKSIIPCTFSSVISNPSSSVVNILANSFASLSLIAASNLSIAFFSDGLPILITSIPTNNTTSATEPKISKLGFFFSFDKAELPCLSVFGVSFSGVEVVVSSASSVSSISVFSSGSCSSDSSLCNVASSCFSVSSSTDSSVFSCCSSACRSSVSVFLPLLSFVQLWPQ